MRLAFKVCLIGSPGVGKTSLVLRYVKNYFKDNYVGTIGADFLIKEINFPKMNLEIKLLIWDIGGQSKWRDIRSTYLMGSDGAILVFDITRRNTFTDLNDWIEDLNRYVGTKIPFVIVGNKIDLDEFEMRDVPKDEIKEVTKQYGVHYFETSAKTGEVVETMFTRSAFDIIKNKAIILQEKFNKITPGE
ncbi:MAG: GTP-binding protein [Candidatus Helarchaeota archaeon]|nr:GTP-binding protein [Candidatus Helarchaeota archaeon]